LSEQGANQRRLCYSGDDSYRASGYHIEHRIGRLKRHSSTACPGWYWGRIIDLQRQDRILSVWIAIDQNRKDNPSVSLGMGATRSSNLGQPLLNDPPAKAPEVRGVIQGKEAQGKEVFVATASVPAIQER
jgi:hypothetical protein